MMPLKLLTHLSGSPRFSVQSGLYTHEQLPCVLASILEKAARERYDVSCLGLAEALDFIKIYATRANLTSQSKSRISAALESLRAPNPNFCLTYVGGEPDGQAAFVMAYVEGTQVMFAGEVSVSEGFDCACGLISVFLRCGLFAAVEPHHGLLCSDVLHAGCNVQLVGLQGKVGLNGRTGCCHSWDRSKEKWQVKLQDAVSDPIWVCPRNLLLLGVDASQFPFQGRVYKLAGQTNDRRQQLSCDESFLYEDELQCLSEAGADPVQIPAAEAVGKIKRAMHLDAVADALDRGSALSSWNYEEEDAQEHLPDGSLILTSLRRESFQLRKIVWPSSRIYYARSALKVVQSEQERNPSQVLAELRDVPDPQDCILTCARLNNCRAEAYALLSQFELANEKFEQALAGFTECLNEVRFSPVRRTIRFETLILRSRFAEICEPSILTWEQILQAIDEHFPDGEMLESKYRALYSIGRIHTDEGNYLEATRKVAELAQLSRADSTALCNILRFQLSGSIALHNWGSRISDRRPADEDGHVPHGMHETVINGIRFFEEAKLARESSEFCVSQEHHLVVLRGLVRFYEQLHAWGVSDKNRRRLKYALAIHAYCTASLGTEDAETCYACIDLGKAFRDLGDTPAACKFLKLGRGIAQLRGLHARETLAHDALQELAPGEAVVKSRLFMPEVMQNKCDNLMCRNLDTPASRFQKCSGCLVARYCSQGCQTEAYTAHKKLCKKLRLTTR
ncbi:unnamed protein product [Polarella glacialis]|uniref:MYND-type domain-containing protein n=1 Tax=Polarella glacialis TaxID=89957 RepID=A0A813KCD2_POLGL|nr:unnamed protein product [Polarella glacialis]